MKKSIILVPMIIFLWANPLLAQNQKTYDFGSGDKNIQITFIKPDVFRVKTGLTNTFEESSSYMLIEKEWNGINVKKEEDENHIFLESNSLKLKINKTTLQISVFNPEGDLISDEESNIHGGLFQQGDQTGIRKKLFPEEHFFGFGERMDFLDQKGKALNLNVGRGLLRPHIIGAYNIMEANYAPVPMMMSTKGYGIFYHAHYANDWDLGKTDPNTLSYRSKDPYADYFFMYGPDFPKLLDHYTDLTGKSPLLPRFAHGLHVGTYSGGTWGYEHLTSGEYVIALAKKYRQKGIPFDVLHLDSTWRMFGKNGGSGATSFEWRETFTDPKRMFDDLYAMDVNMVGLHVRPRFDNGQKLDLLDQARKEGHVYPEENGKGEFVNFFEKESVDWWWENGVKRIAEIGAKFLKTDEGSAFGRQANESNKVGPTSEEAKRLHNVFPVAYAKAPYEKFKEFNMMRGMNHTREGYAGIQRYPFIWAGDWPSEWQYFAPVIRAGINMGLSGVGYWSHNMGGFEHDVDPELFIRWVQFGMFSPVAHVFGMDHPGYKEPWNYGKEAEKVFTDYARLRYRLIPYLYSTAFHQYQSGTPIMRALVLHHQNDFNTYSIDDQYYFGEQMIVCPVTVKEAQTRTIYLPNGDWFDFWDGKKYEGGKYYNVETPLEKMPIYVKSGAIIPFQETVNFDNNEPYGKLTFEIFPGDGNFTLFEDDGISESYQIGNYALTKVSVSNSGSLTKISFSASEGNFSIPTRTVGIKVHLGKTPQKVILNGKVLSEKTENDEMGFNKEKNFLYFNFDKDPNQEINIEINL